MENNHEGDIDRARKAEQLFEAYCISENIPQLVELASQIIGMPFHVTDCSYKLLAQSSRGVDEDEVWRDNADLGYLSSRIIADAIGIHRPDKPKKRGDRIFFTWKSKISTHPMLVYYLFHDGMLLGHLSGLCMRGEPSEEDYYLTGLLSDLLAKELYINKAVEDMNDIPYESILTALIETDMHDVDVMENRALATGLNAHDSFFVLNVSVESNFGVLKKKLAKIFPYSRVFFYEYQMVVLCPCLGDKRYISDWELEQITLLAEEMNARICISDEFHSISGLGLHYRKNQRILTLSKLHRKKILEDKLFYPIRIFDEKIYLYDKFKLLDIIYQLSMAKEGLDLYRYVNVAVRGVYEDDRENGSDLLQTLMVYIECQRSYLSAAERLMTHKNTVRYRIDKLKQILATDFGDGGEMMGLYYSCVLLQMVELLK